MGGTTGSESALQGSTRVCATLNHDDKTAWWLGVVHKSAALGEDVCHTSIPRKESVYSDIKIVLPVQ